MDSNNTAITLQPRGLYDELVITPMQRADSQFATVMLIEAFRPKMEHAMGGKDRMGVLYNGLHLEMSTRPEGGYNDIFIAWHQGERAGFMKLRYHDSKELNGDSSMPGIGLCCEGIRLSILDDATSGGVPRGVCYLDTIAVDAKFRGKGIGKSLMMKADQEAIQHGCKTITLAVVDGNPAIHLYERAGYKIKETEDSCCFNFAVGYSKVHNMEKPLL